MRDDGYDSDDQDDERPTGAVECFRCARGEYIRIYEFRPVAGGAELWRIEMRQGESARHVKESDLRGLDEATAFLEELRRALTAGGWR